MPTCIVIHSDALDGSVDAHSSTNTCTNQRKQAMCGLYFVLKKSLSWL